MAQTAPEVDVDRALKRHHRPANTASSNSPAQCNVLMMILQQVLLDSRVFVAQI